MDFEIVKRQIFKAYRKYGDFYWTWELDEFIDVFDYYYRGFQKRFGRSHPRLSTDAIEMVMNRLETSEDGLPYDPEETKALIDQYLQADLDCDYCIAHFVSGDIRAMRLFEAGY